jgi:hypothetical protein
LHAKGNTAASQNRTEKIMFSKIATALVALVLVGTSLASAVAGPRLYDSHDRRGNLSDSIQDSFGSGR